MKLPDYKLSVWLRIAVKLLILLVIFNFAFGFLHLTDAITSISIYGTLAPYRTRMIDADDTGNQFVPLEIMLKAHEISRPKAADEFRVVVLGNSGILGAGNTDDTTISAQITASGQSIRGKHIRAYNLAYPAASITRDFLVADAALDYQPDLLVWFVTIGDFRYDNLYPLIAANQQRMTKLTARFGLKSLAADTYGHFSDDVWQESFLAQRSTLYRWLKLQTSSAIHRYSYPVFSAGIIAQYPLPQEPALKPDDPNFAPMPNTTWDVLSDLGQLTKVPILIINEPMYAVPVEDNPVNYNVEVGRTIYDQYRTTLSQYCTTHSLWCADLWTLVPNREYTDSDYHRTPAGNAIIAAEVIKQSQSALGN